MKVVVRSSESNCRIGAQAHQHVPDFSLLVNDTSWFARMFSDNEVLAQSNTLASFQAALVAVEYVVRGRLVKLPLRHCGVTERHGSRGRDL